MYIYNNFYQKFIFRIMIFFIYSTQAYQVKNDFAVEGSTYHKLTVLTSPIGQGGQSYEGHYAVTRSLIDGLRKIGANFNYNPSRMEDVGDVIFVPSGFEALKQAIQLRKQNRIKKLLAGPNLVGRGHDENNIVANPEIDVYLNPSEWPMINLADDAPSLKGRMHIWYAGVDTAFWYPVQAAREQIKITKNVLVYWKGESESFCQQVEEMVRKHKWNPVRIQYGHYKKDQYKKVLSNVTFAVFISRSESQGLGLVEAWSMDIPTLIWDIEEPLLYREKMWWPINACPYLNDCVGRKWKHLSDLELLITNFQSYCDRFSPRAWVLRNMSDEISAQLLLKIVNSPVDGPLILKLD